MLLFVDTKIFKKVTIGTCLQFWACWIDYHFVCYLVKFKLDLPEVELTNLGIVAGTH